MITLKRTLLVAGMLFAAAAAQAQSTPLGTPVNLPDPAPFGRVRLFNPAESSVAPSREVRLAPITLRTETDRVVQLNLAFSPQTIVPRLPSPASDVRGVALINVSLHVETVVRP